jgi:hypothetical protein
VAFLILPFCVMIFEHENALFFILVVCCALGVAFHYFIFNLWIFRPPQHNHIYKDGIYCMAIQSLKNTTTPLKQPPRPRHAKSVFIFFQTFQNFRMKQIFFCALKLLRIKTMWGLLRSDVLNQFCAWNGTYSFVADWFENSFKNNSKFKISNVLIENKTSAFESPFAPISL